VTEQYDRKSLVLVANHVIDPQSVVNQVRPPAAVRNMSERLAVGTVAAVIVGDNRKTARRRDFRKACVAYVVFTQSMKYLDYSSNRSLGPPVSPENSVLIGAL
jgi:hypothetical protein